MKSCGQCIATNDICNPDCPNAAWYEHEVGGCMKFRPYPVAKSIVPSGLSIGCGCGKSENDHIIPAYDKDTAVMLNAIKNLLKDEGDENNDYGVAITKIEDTYCISNLHTDPPRCLKIHIEDKSLERAAMRAQLKKRGVEV